MCVVMGNQVGLGRERLVAARKFAGEGAFSSLRGSVKKQKSYVGAQVGFEVAGLGEALLAALEGTDVDALCSGFCLV